MKWITDPHAAKVAPVDPPKITREQAKQAIAEALVPVLQGGTRRIDTVIPQVAPVANGSGLTVLEVAALIEEIADEWADGKGPVVPVYVPPVIEKPKPIELPVEPEPVEEVVKP